MSSVAPHPFGICRVPASRGKQFLRGVYLLAIALVGCGIVRAQDTELDKPQPVAPVRHSTPSTPLRIAKEVKATGRDLVTFRDPAWSTLTFAQIGAASADAVTSLNALARCPNCKEGGVSRIFVGQHPDAHKYAIGGIVEVSMEAVTAHYFSRHMAARKWYWHALWAIPQSLSLFEHTRAAYRNSRVEGP